MAFVGLGLSHAASGGDKVIDLLLTAELFMSNFVAGVLPLILYDALLFLPMIIHLRRGKRYSARSLFATSFRLASILSIGLMIFEPEVSAQAAFIFPIIFALIVRRSKV